MIRMAIDWIVVPIIFVALAAWVFSRRPHHPN